MHLHALCVRTTCAGIFCLRVLNSVCSCRGMVDRDWSPFQLNLPITPITDLRVHKGNLIAATSGRSFWILDDLNLIRQYKKDTPAFAIYKPDNAYLVNSGSELDGSSEEFTGANTFRGVNPASGVVVYYQLPELKKTDDVTMEIKDSAGNVVRSPFFKGC